MHSGSRDILYTPPPATDGGRALETDGGEDGTDQGAENETADDAEAATIVPPADD